MRGCCCTPNACFVVCLFLLQFHGYGSGKKKQEKRLKLVAEEKKKERAMDLQRLRYALSWNIV